MRQLPDSSPALVHSSNPQRFPIPHSHPIRPQPALPTPGWLLAVHEDDPARGGLVPRSFLMADDVAVTAPCDFQGVATGDLPFRKGDALLIRPGILAARGYWLASLNGRRGYVPRFLLDPSWRVQGRLSTAIIWAHFLAKRGKGSAAMVSLVS